MNGLYRTLSYKQFSMALAVSTVCVLIFFIVVINIVIDPYNEYRLLSNSSFRTSTPTAFPLFEKLGEKPYTLVFGTSTSAPIDSTCVGGDVLNFSLSLYGEPERIYRALLSLKPKQLKNIKKIYYAVEYNTFHANEVTNINVDYTARYDFYYQTISNIQKPKIVASLDWLVKKLTHQADSQIDQFGVYQHLSIRPFNSEGFEKKVVFTHEPQQVVYLKKLAEFAQEKNISFVVFRTVTSKAFLERVDFQSLEQHFARVLEAVPSFYSLMWLENASGNLNYFRDPIHPTYEVTKMEMSELLSDNAKNYLVTKDNLNSYISFLKQKSAQANGN